MINYLNQNYFYFHLNCLKFDNNIRKLMINNEFLHI